MAVPWKKLSSAGSARRSGVQRMAVPGPLSCPLPLCIDRAMAATNLLADTVFIHTESATFLIWMFCSLCLTWAYIFVQIQTNDWLKTLEISLLHLSIWIDKNLQPLETILWNVCLGFEQHLSFTDLIYLCDISAVFVTTAQFFTQKCYSAVLYICKSSLVPVSVPKTTIWFAFQTILINPSLD